MLAFSGPADVVTFATNAFAPLRRGRPARVDHRADVTLNARARVTFDGHELPIPLCLDYEVPFYATRDVFAAFAAAGGSSWAMYGAAVELANTAVLLLGPPASGKTVLLLHLLAAGARFYSDETFIVDRRDRTVEGMPRQLMIRETSLRYLPDDRMRRACAVSPHVLQTPSARVWYAIDPHALLGRNVAASPAPIGAIVLVERHDSVTKLEPLHAKIGSLELARRLYRRPADFGQLAELGRACDRVPTYRLSSNDPRGGAALLLERILQ